MINFALNEVNGLIMDLNNMHLDGKDSHARSQIVNFLAQKIQASQKLKADNTSVNNQITDLTESYPIE